MVSRLAKPFSGLIVLLVLALAVSACGRRGGLEPPPSQTTMIEGENAQETEPASKPDRPFILDPLL